jgi:hypothetical protein
LQNNTQINQPPINNTPPANNSVPNKSAEPNMDKSNNKIFDKEPFDAGVEADEETDPKKFIEQLSGKLGQSLRKYSETQKEPDFQLEKFAINSVISATHTSEMDADDQKDIINKVKKAGQNDKKIEPNNDNVSDLDEFHIYEDKDNFFIQPIKNNMFQKNSNDILEEDRCTKIAKKKYDVWPSAYASGAVVRCRQGKIWKNLKEENLNEIDNYKNMTDEQLDEKWSQKYKRSIDCNNPKGFSQRAHCQGRKKHNESINEVLKKTDFSKEKESGLHGWFSRRGGEGVHGWVDCNTCREGKCKPCGRKDDENRSKYPACRPTPSACKTKGRGESWGKKTENESEYNVYKNMDKNMNKNMSESNNYMFWSNLKTIVHATGEIMKMDCNKIDLILLNGHGWAIDHIATSNDDIEEVYHFLEGKMNYDDADGYRMNEEYHKSNNYMFWQNLKSIYHSAKDMLDMDYDMVDSILSDGHGWALDHVATSTDDIEEVYHFLESEIDSYDDDAKNIHSDEYGSVQSINEAEYRGRTIKLNKPMRGDVKKFKVYVKNDNGNIIKVNFGDPNMEIKRDDPKRRKSFRARHKCSEATDKTTPKYWSCKMWSKKPVSDIIKENLVNDNKGSNFDKKIIKNMLRETFLDTTVEPKTQPIVKPAPTKEPSKAPSRRNKPFLPMPTPGIEPDPKAIK